MAVSNLVCPDCATVLRPAKPVAVGKRVKCPKCGTIFAATDDEEDELEGAEAGERDQPAAQGRCKRASPVTKKPADEAKASTGIEYESSTYGVVKEPEDQEVEEKEERGADMVTEFLKEAKTKDPRGPAQALVVRPSNWLIITGVCGIGGYAIL